MASQSSGVTSFLQLKKDRRASRFTLLFLEYNEFLLQDLAVYKYEAPTSDLSWVRSSNGRIGGRLKLCTRGLIFEPTTDSRAPIVRFPFKSMMSPMKPYKLAQGSALATQTNPSSLFYFDSSLCIDIEINGRVAPFVTHEFKQPTGLVFQLQHSTVHEFLEIACELQRIESLRNAFSDSKKLLRPILDQAIGKGGPQFELRNLVDFSEKVLTTSPIRVDRVRPLVRNPGILMITNREIYFQPSNLNNTGESVEHFPLRRIAVLVRRRHMLRHTGLELSLDDQESTAFFNFESPKVRDQVWNMLLSQPDVQKAVAKTSDLRRMVKAWQNKEISNFDYLNYLNSIADRSIHDLTQYPVYPWVIKDYTSNKLDLEDPSTFRDLSKPMGALDDQRLQYFLERFEMMPPEDPSTGMPPPFLYGSHYSTPGFVLFYLVRAAPQHMLSLQSGKFDAPDRMFSSVQETFASATQNPSDVKELVPEFYSGDGSFLLNEQNLPLGVQQDGEVLNHVKMPPWCKSPRDFVKKCRKALDCDFVSDRLHLWIDLIFGYKQRGKAAIDAHNLFYYLTYEGAVDLEAISDPNKRAALESQINEFGQCPKQLFLSAHPKRNASTKELDQLEIVSSLDSRIKSNEKPKPPPLSSSTATSSTTALQGAASQDLRQNQHVSLGGGAGGGGGGGDIPLPRPPPPPRQQPPSQQFQSSEQDDQSSGFGRVFNRVGSSVESMFSRIKERGLNDFSPTTPNDTKIPPTSTSASTSAQHHSETSTQEVERLVLPPPTFGKEPSPPSTSTSIKQQHVNLENDQTSSSSLHQNQNKDQKEEDDEDDVDDIKHQMAIQSMLDEEDELNERSKEIGTMQTIPKLNDPQSTPFTHSMTDNITRTLTPPQTSHTPPPPQTSSQTSSSFDNYDNNDDEVVIDPGQCGGMLQVVATAEGLRAHKDTITSVNLSYETEVAVSVARDGALRVTPLASFFTPTTSPPVSLNNKSANQSSDSSSSLSSSSSSSPSIILNKNNKNSNAQRRLFQATDLPLSSCSLANLNNNNTSDLNSNSNSNLGVVCGSWDNTIFLYSVTSACVLGRRINAHDDSVSCVHTSKHLIVSGSWDATVKVWSLKKGRSPRVSSSTSTSTSLPFIGIDPNPLFEIFDHENPVCCVAIDEQIQFIASGADDGRIVINSVNNSGDHIETIELSYLYESDSNCKPPLDHEKCYAITSLVWSDHIFSNSNGNNSISGGGGGGGLKYKRKNYIPTLFVSSRYGKIHEFATSGQCLKTVNTFGYNSMISPLSLCLCGSLILCSGEKGFLQIWSWKLKESVSSSIMKINEPKLLYSNKSLLNHDITSLSIDPTGHQLLTGCEVSIKLWNILPSTEG